MKIHIFLSLVYLLLLVSCAAFPGENKIISKMGAKTNLPVRLYFTGFTFFEKERIELRKEILKSGYTEDPNAKVLLEIILEEQNPDYPYPKLHFANFFMTIVSGTVIPFHIISDHRIVYRFRENAKVFKEAEIKTRIHQYRGILVTLIMPFYWPSHEFRANLIDTWKWEREVKR